MEKQASEQAWEELVEKLRHVKMSPAEKEAQRRSFAYGNLAIENPAVTRQIIDQAAERLATFRKLSISEIMLGIFLNIGDRRFTEQQLYRFLQAIDCADRFRVRVRSVGGFYSESVRRALSFMEMGMVFEDWMETYKVRNSMRPSIKKELAECGILPKYNAFFQELARLFAASLPKTNN